MAQKITYQDKVKVRIGGPDVNTWRDADANEIKSVVNANADLIEVDREASSVTFDRLGGWTGSPTSPLSGTINIDLTGAINGAVNGVYYDGAVVTGDSFSGVNIGILSGQNTANELCIVWMCYDSLAGVAHVNIQTGIYGGGTPPSGPTATAPVITVTEPVSPSATAPTITVT